MTALRPIITIIVLLLQALPVSLMGGESAPENCPMSCCAALVKAGLSECACEAVPSVPKAPAPASLPPAQDRETLPQSAWAEVPDFLIPFSIHADTGRSLPSEAVMQTVTTPHVRLTVLFCSFLT